MKKSLIALAIASLLFATPGYTQAETTEKEVNQTSTEGYIQGSAFENGGYSSEAGTPVVGNWSYNLPFNGTSTNKVKWSIDLPEIPFTTPTVDKDGNIYMVNRSSEVVSYSKKGEERWRFTLNSGEASSVVIGEDDTLYVSGGPLYALDTDGTLKWKTNISGTRFTQTPGLGKDGTIYIGNHGNGSYYNLYAFNPDGSMKWKSPDLRSVAGDNKSPLISKDGTIYLLTSGKLSAVNPDGTLKWEKLVNGSKNYFTLTKEGKILVPTPASGYRVQIFNPDGTEESAIQFTMETNVHTVIQSQINGDIIIPNGKNISSYNIDGKLNWKYETNGKIFTSVILDKEGVIYFANTDGIFTALHPDGTVKWSLNLKEELRYRSIGLLEIAQSMGVDKNGTFYMFLTAYDEDLVRHYELIAIGDDTEPSGSGETCEGYLEEIERKLKDGSITEEEINEAQLRLSKTLYQLSQKEK